jgi:AAHS family 4-hydroxybenzoate transporter-like MFS transporter
VGVLAKGFAVSVAIANLSEILDGRDVGTFQKRVVALCAAIAFVDGIEGQLAGYIAPALRQDLGLTPSQLGFFLASGPLGLLFGGLLIAPLADRLGRRPILIACVTLFGICSLLTAMSNSLFTLDVFRFLTGLGVGGALANSISLTAEYSPAHRRSFMVAIMLLGFITGSIAVGLISAQVVPILGWRSVLVIGGALSLMLVPFLYFTLPESIRFLAVREGSHDDVARLIRRLDPTLAIDRNTRLVMDEHREPSVSVLALFREGRARTTVLLWTIYFMSLLTLYLMSSWVTTHVHSLGAAVAVAILIGTLFQVGGVFGTVFGWMVDRLGAGVTIFSAYATGAVAIACIGFAGSNLVALAMAVFAAGFGIIGGQSATNALAAISYPTQIRSTGVGWATGIGRIGSIIGPSLAGVLVGVYGSTQSIFFLAIIPPLCACLAGVVLSSHKAWLGAKGDAPAE